MAFNVKFDKRYLYRGSMMNLASIHIYVVSDVNKVQKKNKKKGIITPGLKGFIVFFFFSEMLFFQLIRR